MFVLTEMDQKRNEKTGKGTEKKEISIRTERNLTYMEKSESVRVEEGGSCAVAPTMEAQALVARWMFIAGAADDTTR